MFAVLIFTIVFGYFARMPSDGMPYPVFAFAAVLPWTYFAEARAPLRPPASSTDAELVRKVYFPRLIIPLAGVISPLVDFCIAFCRAAGVMAFYGIVPSWNMLLVPPLMVVVGAAGALASGCGSGPINVRFRDVMHTLPFMMQVWMFATPDRLSARA